MCSRPSIGWANCGHEVARLWHEMDVLVLPAIGTTFTVDEVFADPIGANTKLGHYTHFGNLLDLCAVVVPAGLTADGRPAALMILGPALADDRVLAVAARTLRHAGRSAAATALASAAETPVDHGDLAGDVQRPRGCTGGDLGTDDHACRRRASPGRAAPELRSLRPRGDADRAHRDRAGLPTAAGGQRRPGPRPGRPSRPAVPRSRSRPGPSHPPPCPRSSPGPRGRSASAGSPWPTAAPRSVSWQTLPCWPVPSETTDITEFGGWRNYPRRPGVRSSSPTEPFHRTTIHRNDHRTTSPPHHNPPH